MGKKKAFIDKKKAVTYSLVYREASEDPDGEDGGQRVLAPVGSLRGTYPLSEDHHDYHENEGSVYESEYSLPMSRSAAAHHDESYTLTEERRRELLALGFPDDGYDYLKHLRDLGRGKAAPAAAGRGGVATIPEDQELDGFEDGDTGEWQEGSETEEDFTIYDQRDEEIARAAAAAAATAAGERKKLDAAALAEAEAAAAAAVAEAAGPSTPTGRRVAASSSAGPGPGSTRAAAAAAASAAARSAAGRSGVARSIATTARSHGSGLGPSVYVPAARLVAPKPDVKVIDARRLMVQPKGHDEAAAAAALVEVTALARHTELHGKRGRLYQDLDELEKSMAAMENGNDPSRAEQVEGDEWATWLDEFVAGGGDDNGGGGGAPAGAGCGMTADEDEDDGEVGGESEEPEEEEEDEEEEEEEEDADEWRMRHRRERQQQRLLQQQQQQQQQQQPDGALEGGSDGTAAPLAAARDGAAALAGGIGAASVSSSLWRRPDRRDRKQGFEALDAQFERLAIEYDDAELGALDDGRYDEEEEEAEEEEDVDPEGAFGRSQGARQRGSRASHPPAAGMCELSDFADVLDEFLTEHRAAETLEAEGLRPMQASYDVTLLASRPDPEALAATRARIKRQMEAGAIAGQDDPVQAIFVQEAERWDCESILSLTSNLENHPAKIVEPQRRTGGRGGGIIRLSVKTGMPVLSGAHAGARGPAAIPEEAQTEEYVDGAADEGSGSDVEGTPAGSVLDPALLTRHKGETAEERKARKAAVKEARRNQRTAKKEMKTMFRQQATRAQKQTAGKSLAAGATYSIP